MPRTLSRKTLVAVALATFAFLGSASAAVAQTDVTGVWEVTMTTPDGPNTVDVSFKQQGTALTGELTSPLGVAPFKGTIAGDTISIVAPIDIQGMALNLTFDVKVTGDKLAGTVKFGDLGEAPLEGKRKSAAAAPAAAAAAAPAAAPAATAAATTGSAGISGNWNIVVNVQGAEVPLAATFTQAGEKFSGTFTSDQGSFPVSGTITGNALKAEFTATTPAGDMAIVMTGQLSPSGGLSGKMNITGLGEADWVGTKK